MPDFEKRPGAPAGTLTVSVGGGTFTFTDGGVVTVTNQEASINLRQHPYIRETASSASAPPVYTSSSLISLLQDNDPQLGDVIQRTANGWEALPPGAVGSIPVLKGGILEVYNTSRSAGTVPELGGNSGGPYDIADRFSCKLAGALGMSERMLATAGATVAWDEASAADATGETGGGWVTIMHRVRRPRVNANANYDWHSPISMATSADWVNDWARVNGGTAGTRQNTRTTNIMKHVMRFVYSHACAARIWEPDSTAGSGLSNLVYGGTSSHVAVTYSAVRPRAYRGAVSGPKGYRSMANASTIQIPLPADYPGSATAPLAVCFGGVAAITSGQVTVSGAGASGNAKTLDLTGANVADPNHINPLVLRFVGNDIPAGASTITLTVTVAGANARFLRAWIESPSPPEVLAYNTQQMNPATPTLYFTHMTEADYDYGNARQAEVVAEFGSHVKLVDIDAVVGGTNPASAYADKGRFFSDTMHGPANVATEYALEGLKAYAGITPTADLRKRLFRTRAINQDIKFRGAISANYTTPLNGENLLPIDVELEDHSGMHTASGSPANTRVYMWSVGLWLITFQASWANLTAPGATELRAIGFIITHPDGSSEKWLNNFQRPVAENNLFTPYGQSISVPYVTETAEDYVEFIVYQNKGVNGDAILADPRPFIVVQKLRDA